MKRSAPPGRVVKVNGRWYYRPPSPIGGKKSIPLRTPGAKFATRATAVADRLAWAAWYGANPTEAAGDADPGGPTFAQLQAYYLHYCATVRYYDKDLGTVSSQYTIAEVALRTFGDAHAIRPASDIEVGDLRRFRDRLIGEGKVRSTINNYIGVVVQMYKWALGEGYVAPEVVRPLVDFPRLIEGQTAAHESAAIQPAKTSAILAVIDAAGPILADLLRVHWISGARPGEIVQLAKRYLDMEDPDVWIFTPPAYKTKRHGEPRTIALFAEAIDIIKPYLFRPDDRPLFSPAESEAARHKAQAAARASKPTPSQLRRRASAGPGRAGDAYTTATYRRAVERIIARINAERAAENRKRHAEGLEPIELVEPFTPNQIRHSAGAENRALVSQEVAAILLGHAGGSAITSVYTWTTAKEEALAKAKAEVREAARLVAAAKAAKRKA